MKNVSFFLFLFISCAVLGQIQGKITNTNNNPLSFVSIYLDKTVAGTTSNDNGEYVLDIKKKGSYTVFFQILGYKTQKKEVTITQFPFQLDVKLKEESVTLQEVFISSKDNPANAIIRKTIANKDKNTDKFAKYTAKFYSKGLYKIKNAPKKFLGQSLGDFGGGLDSARSGIVYLSETISEVTYQKKPKKFKENIIASKVSGQDNGISFNRAEDASINLYDNIVEFGNDLISPISTNAFGYYNYKLQGSFYTENGKLINKIAIIPKRDNDRVFKGFIYIVEDDWALYGADVSVTGAQVNIPLVDVLHLKQNYNYAEINQAWVLISQSIDFKVNAFGFKVDGRFSAAFSGYNFLPNYTKNTFSNQVLTFAKEATEKDSVYWNNIRPVPLTSEEIKDYKFKDSIKVVRKSKPYLDSINKIQNKINWLSPITGYSYKNSYKQWAFSLDGLVDDFSFNTVQGFNTSLGVSYFKRKNKTGNWWSVVVKANYGFSEKAIRPTVFFTKNWNNVSNPNIEISGGVTTAQFNQREPISKLDNTIRSLFFRENYLKIYEKQFAKFAYSEELTNGIYFSSSIEYANRKPLFNTSNYSFASTSKNAPYISNNPLNTVDFVNPAFTEHKIATLNLGATFVIRQKYLSYPDRKFNLETSDYPKISLNYSKKFGANNSDLHSDVFIANIKQNINAGNYGDFYYNIRAGAFLKKKDIAFMDYLQANGNQLTFVTGDQLDNFGLLEYYKFYTNDKYTEAHVEHNFKGYILQKIPLVNSLGFHLVSGAKGLFMANKKPYTEYSIGIDNVGFGKWRFLRIDYVRSNYKGIKNDGFLLRFNLLDIF